MARYSLKTGKKIDENTSRRMTRTLGSLYAAREVTRKALEDVNQSAKARSNLIKNAAEEIEAHLSMVRKEEVFNEKQMTVLSKLLFALKKATERGIVNPIREILLQISHTINQMIEAPKLARKVHRLKELSSQFSALYTSNNVQAMLWPENEDEGSPQNKPYRDSAKKNIIRNAEKSQEIIDLMYKELNTLQELSSTWRGSVAKEIGQIERSLGVLKRTINSDIFPEREWYEREISEPAIRVHEIIGEFEKTLLNVIKRGNPERVVNSYLSHLDKLNK